MMHLHEKEQAPVGKVTGGVELDIDIPRLIGLIIVNIQLFQFSRDKLLLRLFRPSLRRKLVEHDRITQNGVAEQFKAGIEPFDQVRHDITSTLYDNGKRVKMQIFIPAAFPAGNIVDSS